MPPVRTSDATPPLEVLRSRPVQAALLVVACALVLELTPQLERFRLFGKRPSQEPTALAPQPSASVGESQLGLETTAPRAAPGQTQLLPAQAQEAKALEQAPPVP